MALDNVSLMSWTTAEIEEQSERQPKLGIALLQMLDQARVWTTRPAWRVSPSTKPPSAWFAPCCALPSRWARRTDDGAIGIPPLTHQVLAQYVGTTREIITFQMNQLRQKGLLRYSRKGIQIYPDALREYLHVLGHQTADFRGYPSAAHIRHCGRALITSGYNSATA